MNIQRYQREGETPEQCLLRVIHDSILLNTGGEDTSRRKDILHWFSPAVFMVEKRWILDWNRATSLVKARLKYILLYGDHRMIYEQVISVTPGVNDQKASLTKVVKDYAVSKMMSISPSN